MQLAGDVAACATSSSGSWAGWSEARRTNGSRCLRCSISATVVAPLYEASMYGGQRWASAYSALPVSTTGELALRRTCRRVDRDRTGTDRRRARRVPGELRQYVPTRNCARSVPRCAGPLDGAMAATHLSGSDAVPAARVALPSTGTPIAPKARAGRAPGRGRLRYCSRARDARQRVPAGSRGYRGIFSPRCTTPAEARRLFGSCATGYIKSAGSLPLSLGQHRWRKPGRGKPRGTRPSPRVTHGYQGRNLSLITKAYQGVM